MISRSAALACSRAFSGVGRRNALSCGSSASARAINASVSSTGDNRRRSISRAASAIVSQCRSVGAAVRSSGTRVAPKALSGDKRAIWGISLWRDSVVPLAVEFGAFDVDCGHLGVRDDNAAGVLASVEFAAHGEAGFGGGGRDQFDDDPVADERLGAPVLADEGEEPVFDFVP